MDARTKRIYIQGIMGGRAAAEADFSSVAQQLEALSSSAQAIEKMLALHRTALTPVVESMVRAHSCFAEVAKAFDPMRGLIQEITRSQRLFEVNRTQPKSLSRSIDGGE